MGAERLTSSLVTLCDGASRQGAAACNVYLHHEFLKDEEMTYQSHLLTAKAKINPYTGCPSQVQIEAKAIVLGDQSCTAGG